MLRVSVNVKLDTFAAENKFKSFQQNILVF